MTRLAYTLRVAAKCCLQTALFVAACGTGMSASTIHAATIDYKIRTGDSAPLEITIKGPIVLNDDRRFYEIAKLVAGYNGPVMVKLDSLGGLFPAGLAIGDIIHGQHWTTSVSENTRCVSTCGVIWLSGVRRWSTATSLIGFHAVYDATSGQEVGSGNALLGSYLAKWGLKDEAIVFLTTPGPNQAIFLTEEIANRYNITHDGQLPFNNAAINSLLQSPQITQGLKRPFRVYDVSDGFLQLRKGPGPQYEEVTKIPEGAIIMVGRCVPLSGGWKPFCEVEWKGLTGWASSCCMADLGEQTSIQKPEMRLQVQSKCGAGPRLQVAGCILSGYHPLDCMELRRQLETMDHCQW